MSIFRSLARWPPLYNIPPIKADKSHLIVFATAEINSFICCSSFDSLSNGFLVSAIVALSDFALDFPNLTRAIANLQIAEVPEQQALRELLRPQSSHLIPSLDLQRNQLLSFRRFHRTAAEFRRLGGLGHKSDGDRHGRSPSFRRGQAFERIYHPKDVQHQLVLFGRAVETLLRVLGL